MWYHTPVQHTPLLQSGRGRIPPKSFWTFPCSFSSTARSLEARKGLVSHSFTDLVGNTPLVRLRRASELTRCTILGKCEFVNPGGSVKDRPAARIIKQAEIDGFLEQLSPKLDAANTEVSAAQIKPTTPRSTSPLYELLSQSLTAERKAQQARRTIVEGSAGNTAIGLALAGASKGYTVICVIPNTQTQEKKDALRQSGAILVEVDRADVWHPNHFVKYSGRLAKMLRAFWANQFDNQVNRLSHYETTGPEIWEQTRLDGFICAVGTGGSLAGVSQYLRELDPSIKIGLADIPGAGLYRFFSTGEMKGVGTSIVENIGQRRLTGNLQGFTPDMQYEIPDSESLLWCHALLKEEGLAVGMSSGVNVAGAVRMAKDLGPGHTIATLLCDYGQRYAKKQYDTAFLRSLSLPYPDWLDPERCKYEQELLEHTLEDCMASQVEIERAAAAVDSPNCLPANKK